MSNDETRNFNHSFFNFSFIFFWLHSSSSFVLHHKLNTCYMYVFYMYEDRRKAGLGSLKMIFLTKEKGNGMSKGRKNLEEDEKGKRG